MFPTVSFFFSKSDLIINISKIYLAAAVVKSAEGGSVGRRVLASRHNELIIKSMDSPKVN
jgi:hypothetical protein